MVSLGNAWDMLLKEEFESPYYLALREFLKTEYTSHRVYPDMYAIFRALTLTPPEAVKVVILGQDPYHGAGQAHGLAFSVQKGIAPPPSLVNIYRELAEDIGMKTPAGGDLTPWAMEGVLLLNTTLTVREGQAGSHRGHGWETFTDRIVSLLNTLPQPIVYLLWGSNARAKKKLISNPAHLVLESVHPSPLSAYNGFFGCRHFSRANTFLEAHGARPVKWDSIA